MDAMAVLSILSALRIGPDAEEMAIHRAIDEALKNAGVSFLREARLGPGDRIDFLTESGVGIEVKKGRPEPSVLRRQLGRYARWDAVKALVVIDQRAVNLPETVCGKPCYQLGLDRLWGIAL